MNREREWVMAWRRAGRELELQKQHELSRLEHVPESVLDSLFELGLRFARPRRTSGLVEQQRLFRGASR